MAPIEGIKLGFKLADLANSQGKKFTNIKLKNNAELNILKNVKKKKLKKRFIYRYQIYI